MLAFLNDPTVTKFGTGIEKENAAIILMERGASTRLIMYLTGSGGSGKSFVLKATKSFCQQFCRAIRQPFDESVFIVSATTNTAAAQVQSDIIHSLAGLRSRLSNILRNGKINWKSAKYCSLMKYRFLT
jgi:predicted ATP-binding protein involved in virulence